jgi:hypothetical protein
MARVRDRIRASVGLSYPRIATLFALSVLVSLLPPPFGPILTLALGVIFVVLLSGLVVAMRGSAEGRLLTGTIVAVATLWTSIAVWSWLDGQHTLALSAGINVLFAAAALALAACEA